MQSQGQRRMEAHEKTAVCHASLRRRPNTKHCSFACWPACSFFLQSTAHYLISLAQLAAPWKSRCQERPGQGQGVANREQHRINRPGIAKLAASFAQARVPAPRFRPEPSSKARAMGSRKQEKGSINTTGCTYFRILTVVRWE